MAMLQGLSLKNVYNNFTPYVDINSPSPKWTKKVMTLQETRYSCPPQYGPEYRRTSIKSH